LHELRVVSDFQYCVFEIARGREAWTALSASVREGSKSLSTSGGMVALFAPQLGFASNEAAVLARGIDAKHLTPAGVVLRVQEDTLSATVRPREGQRLREGGIYVHRWFTIDGCHLADFIDLSERAWAGFEGSYDTEIFGLFAAQESASDALAGARRLLLLTWYGDHGVWKASREPTRDAASLFAQRHLLTRMTIGRSSVRVL